MKKAKAAASFPEMRAEYDFSKGVRGKYAHEYAKGTNIIVLDPDLVALFPDSKSVNETLRALARIAKARVLKPSHKRPPSAKAG